MYSFFSRELTIEQREALAEAGQTAERVEEVLAVN
jgi:hypothetical protein